MNYYLVRFLIFLSVLLFIIYITIVIGIIFKIKKVKENTKNIIVGKLTIIYPLVLLLTITLITFFVFEKNYMFNTCKDAVRYTFPFQKMTVLYENEKMGYINICKKYCQVIEIKKTDGKWNYIPKNTKISEELKENKLGKNGNISIIKSKYSSAVLILIYPKKDGYTITDSINSNVLEIEFYNNTIFHKYIVLDVLPNDYYITIDNEQIIIN